MFHLVKIMVEQFPLHHGDTPASSLYLLNVFQLTVYYDANKKKDKENSPTGEPLGEYRGVVALILYS
jgi:hypothetical protein